jgi:hypothetical protein
MEEADFELPAIYNCDGDNGGTLFGTKVFEDESSAKKLATRRIVIGSGHRWRGHFERD